MWCLPDPLIPLGTHTAVNKLEVWWEGGEAPVTDVRGTGQVTCDGMEVTISTPRYTVSKKLVKSIPASALGCAISTANKHMIANRVECPALQMLCSVPHLVWGDQVHLPNPTATFPMQNLWNG